MKNILVYLITLTLFILLSNLAFSQGRIIEVEDGDFYTIYVKGYASKNMWLGCTINPDSYNEVDLKPQKVTGGRFTISFNLSSGSISNVMKGKTTYVVALWENKISLKQCKRKYGKGSERCKWARQNGFQMEGRVDRYSGSY